MGWGGSVVEGLGRAGSEISQEKGLDFSMIKSVKV